MTEQSRHWDGVSLGDATLAPYSASEWADQEKLEHGQGSVFPNYGILSGTGDGTWPPLFVAAKSPASSNIEIEVGAALVRGYLYENTSALTLAVGANASGNPRIDTVVLRADFVAQTIRAVIKQGAPAASPVRVAMQQDTSIWEIPLADIAVANGFSTLVQTTITQRQRAIQSLQSGWMPYAFPMNYAPNVSYDASFAAFANNDMIAVPIYLGANMLIQDMTFRYIGGAANVSVNWGLYIEDLNDGNTAEGTLRLVASGLPTIATIVAGNVNVNIPVTPAPQAVPPGLYWLVLQNVSGSTIGIGRTASSFPLEARTNMSNTAGAFTISQTLDFVTSWVVGNVTYGIMLRGRVFGRTTVF